MLSKSWRFRKLSGFYQCDVKVPKLWSKCRKLQFRRKQPYRVARMLKIAANMYFDVFYFNLLKKIRNSNFFWFRSRKISNWLTWLRTFNFFRFPFKFSQWLEVRLVHIHWKFCNEILTLGYFFHKKKFFRTFLFSTTRGHFSFFY